MVISLVGTRERALGTAFNLKVEGLVQIRISATKYSCSGAEHEYMVADELEVPACVFSLFIATNGP